MRCEGILVSKSFKSTDAPPMRCLGEDDKNSDQRNKTNQLAKKKKLYFAFVVFFLEWLVFFVH